MGTRGPKPKPQSYHESTGNASKRPARGDMPGLPLVTLPPAPGWLNASAQRTWHHLGSEFISRGVLTSSDLSVLAMLCEAWALYLEAVNDIASGGTFATSDKGYEYLRPCVMIRNQTLAQVRAISAKFGMTPLDRIGLGTTTQTTTDPLDPLADVLGTNHDDPPPPTTASEAKPATKKRSPRSRKK